MEKSNEHSIALHHCWTELSIFLAEDSLITVQTTFPSTMVYIVGHVLTLSYVKAKCAMFKTEPWPRGIYSINKALSQCQLDSNIFKLVGGSHAWTTITQQKLHEWFDSPSCPPPLDHPFPNLETHELKLRLRTEEDQGNNGR